MKAYTLAIVLISTLTAASAQQATTGNASKEKTIPEAFIKSTGGFIIDKNSTKGHIAIVNSQRAVDPTAILKHANRMESVLSLKIKCLQLPTPVDFANLDEAIAKGEGSMTVILTENTQFPALISIPEKRCALVNVTQLAKDGVDTHKVQDRALKEVARALCFGFAVPYSGAAGSIMDPVASLQELDRILVDNIGVAQKMPIERVANQYFDMRGYRRTTYLKACQEGWAPAPTNDVQRAIWEETRKLPTKPIKIEFDPAKGK